ncbi:MFS transporter [Nocardiopsis quinghaiensis]|uniref:hypothetical protein n=1 Tax=Nocardiopsis quinghaiensis TaxID=464995 RepID=UPI001CC25764|nr:hypothetical protein [Nocardiopsis quinghaiensis]
MTSGASGVSGVPARVLTAARTHRGLVTLCVTVTTSYGVLFYAFPVLSPAISSDTGWSLTTVTALFSASQVMAGLGTVAVGRWLHHRGPRPVMASAALVAVPSLAVLASARDLWLFGAALAGPLGGYPAAFTVLGALAAAGAATALASGPRPLPAPP